jgi:hypothetical protein
VINGAYASYVARHYSTDDCTGDSIGVWSESGSLWVANGFITTNGALLPSLTFNSIDYFPGDQCTVETGVMDLYQESSIGVAAPSWTTDGTQMLKDLR